MSPEQAETIDYRSIPKLTSEGNYQVDVPWAMLDMHLEMYNVDMDPDFQRGHVWTTAQRIAYVENRLRGENASRTLHFNNPNMNRRGKDMEDRSVLVDGKQRLTSALMFIHDELPAFGYLYSQFRHMDRISFRFCINDLQTRTEVLKWYLELNTGGVVHTQEELDRVRGLLESEQRGVHAKGHRCSS